MTKNQLTAQLTERHEAFLTYINGLSQEECDFSLAGKWSARQQLHHMILSVAALTQAYSMPSAALEKMFGKTTRSNRTYQEILDAYLHELKKGGKAPAQYVPETGIVPEEESIKKLRTLVKNLNSGIERLKEKELETLLIPHPLLGKITLKEMLYNAIYHVQHHHEQAEKNLRQR